MIHEVELAKKKFSEERSLYRLLCRREQQKQANERDSSLFEISQKATALKFLKKYKVKGESNISQLNVNGTMYSGENIAEGFYKNIKDLKSSGCVKDYCQMCSDVEMDYMYIMELCQHGHDIPLLSTMDAQDLLHALRPFV